MSNIVASTTDEVRAKRDERERRATRYRKLSMRKLEFYPENPLIAQSKVKTKAKTVYSKGITASTDGELVNMETGELVAVSTIRTIEEKDEAEFVKVFSAGIVAMYELSRSASRVFQAVLREYEQTPMTGGFADCIYLSWFGDGLCGKDIGMSEATFLRGMHELVEKKFLAPAQPNLFWVNPYLFFKGDRVRFIKEYRRKRKAKSVSAEEKPVLEAKERTEENA